MATKCDGNHGGDICGDPECWQIDPCDGEHSGAPCDDAHCYKKELHKPREAVADPDAYLIREA